MASGSSTRGLLRSLAPKQQPSATGFDRTMLERHGTGTFTRTARAVKPLATDIPQRLLGISIGVIEVRKTTNAGHMPLYYEFCGCSGRLPATVYW